jgi:cell wall-associated NlpC family hydrolase
VQRFTPALVRARVVTGTLAVVLTAITSHAALAQADLTLGPFLGYERLVLNQPVTIGLDITGFVGPIGLRGSAGLPRHSFRSTNSSTISDPYDDRLRNWNADGDILFRLVDPNSSHSAFLYGFAGMGVQDRSSPNTTYDPSYQNVRANWSYGLGLSLPLGGLTLTGEARQRRPFNFDGALSSDLTPVREYRLGLSLHFGTGGSSRRYRTSHHRIASTSSSRESTVAATAATVLSSTASSGSSARRVIPTAERYIGTPYRWGGTSPNTGFDCSGFVQYVFAKHGVKLPRTSRQQAQVGSYMPARFSALAPGDLVMFAEDGSNISHVAIYAGGNRIIHATSSGGEVRYDDLDSRRGQWFEDHIVAARRIGSVDVNGLILDLARGFSNAVEFDLGDNAPAVRRYVK